MAVFVHLRAFEGAPPGRTILGVLIGGGVLTVLGWLKSSLLRPGGAAPIDRTGMATWRMAPLAQLPSPGLSRLEKVWMAVLRGYSVLAGGLVLVRIVQLALGRHA